MNILLMQYFNLQTEIAANPTEKANIADFSLMEESYCKN